MLKDKSVNFETTLQFIDYASSMNWPYCLIDADRDTRIGDAKMNELVAHATAKNVKLLVWYNSSGSWNSTEYHPKGKLLTHADRDAAFSKLKEMGIAGIKVDFFGGDGQSMIAYYHAMLKDAAVHELMINFHGETLPRGWQRTPALRSLKTSNFFKMFLKTENMIKVSRLSLVNLLEISLTDFNLQTKKPRKYNLPRNLKPTNVSF